MPGDDGFGFDDDQRRPPVIPDSEEPDPEQSVEARQTEVDRSSTCSWCRKARSSSCKPARPATSRTVINTVWYVTKPRHVQISVVKNLRPRSPQCARRK